MLNQHYSDHEQGSDTNSETKKSYRLEHEVVAQADLCSPYPVFAFIFDDDKYSDQVYLAFPDYLRSINAANISFYATKGTILQVWISGKDAEKYHSMVNQGLIQVP